MQNEPTADRTGIPFFNEEELSVVPLTRAETIPASWYTDERILNVEREHIFDHAWQYVGHECMIPSPGDCHPAGIAGKPVVVVRVNDGSIRAFYNVCRHRGGPLAMEDCSSRMLQCKYHGWTYTLDGQLRGVPKFDRTDLFDKKDYGLHQIPIRSFGGLLFVNPDEHAPKLTEFLKGIRERIAPVDFSGFRFYRRVEYAIRCNWKVYVDNYLEGYHVPLVHPGLSTILDYARYSTEVSDYYSLQHTPLSEEAHSYGVERGGHAYYYHIFPNIMLNILPGRLQTNVVLPQGVDRTSVIFEYFYADMSASALPKIESDIRSGDLIQQEDIGICERVQEGLESRVYHKGRFSPEMEEGVYHFQVLLKRALSKAIVTVNNENGDSE
jgi:choline monooxygenase